VNEEIEEMLNNYYRVPCRLLEAIQPLEIIPMRQYVILYKRGSGKEFARLNPADHANLIDREEVREAIELMRLRPFLEATCVRLDDELFNIVSFTQPAIAPNAFQFTEPA
jgi:hypothetical protein